MQKPFAITLDPGSSLANKTGSWRTERPVYVHRLPPFHQQPTTSCQPSPEPAMRRERFPVPKKYEPKQVI